MRKVLTIQVSFWLRFGGNILTEMLSQDLDPVGFGSEQMV